MSDIGLTKCVSLSQEKMSTLAHTRTHTHTLSLSLSVAIKCLSLSHCHCPTCHTDIVSRRCNYCASRAPVLASSTTATTATFSLLPLLMLVMPCDIEILMLITARMCIVHTLPSLLARTPCTRNDDGSGMHSRASCLSFPCLLSTVVG